MVDIHILGINSIVYSLVSQFFTILGLVKMKNSLKIITVIYSEPCYKVCIFNTVVDKVGTNLIFRSIKVRISILMVIAH